MKSIRTTSTTHSGNQFDLLHLLKERYRAAKRRNANFSLRAFARQLGVDHSSLSQAMRNKRKLSRSTIETICRRWGIDDESTRLFARTMKSTTEGKANVESLNSRRLDPDTFQLISAWQHLALLELIRLDNFKTDSRWIAATLGITVDEVNTTIQRLLRTKLLNMVSSARWQDRSGDTEFHTLSLNSAAGNEIDRSHHELAIQCLERRPRADRHHRQLTFAIDSTRLPRLRVIIDEFIRDIALISREKGRKDEVYTVGVALFPVTTLKHNKGKTDE